MYPLSLPLAYDRLNTYTSGIVGINSSLEQYAYQCGGLSAKYRFNQGVTETRWDRPDTVGSEASGAGDENSRQVSAGGQDLAHQHHPLLAGQDEC
jgi:hypothetical protein